MKNNLNVNINKNFNWELIQKELRRQFGNEIYESWLRKIIFEEKFINYIKSLSLENFSELLKKTLLPQDKLSQLFLMKGAIY